MAVQRIAKGTAATLTLTTTDSDGTAADASGTVTVGVAKADGTAVVTAGTATTHGTTGVYTVALTASQTLTLETLTATWTNGTSTWTTTHEIVGGFLFTVATARAYDTTVLGVSALSPFTDAQLLAARGPLERRVEFILDRACVPRYARLTLDGTGSRELVAPVADVRTIRSARVLSATGSSSYTSLSASALAAIAMQDDGTLRRDDGGIWTEGRANVVLELEYGMDGPPEDLADAILVHLRHFMTRPRSSIPAQATGFTDGDGVTYDLGTTDPYATGIKDVDAVYGAYSRRSRGTTKTPASRPLVWQSQRGSMFHGR